MFEGNLEEGELEIGQVASQCRKLQSAREVIHEIITEYNLLLSEGFHSF